MKIIEFLHENKSHVGFLDNEEPNVMHVFQTPYRLYSIIRDCFDNQASLLDCLQSLPTKCLSLDALAVPPAWLVPALPTELSLARVFGFGYTHKNRKATKALSLPEQFYKGDGTTLFAHNRPIAIPQNSHSISEEAELVILYYHDKQRESHYIGHALGNDLSDPLLRRQHPDNFAASKLRPSSIGAELNLEILPKTLDGCITIKRNHHAIWHATFTTGTSQLLYDIEQLTTLFVNMADIIPDSISYVFLGADTYSFLDGIAIKSHDRIHIASASFMIPLSNQLVF